MWATGWVDVPFVRLLSAASSWPLFFAVSWCRPTRWCWWCLAVVPLTAPLPVLLAPSCVIARFHWTFAVGCRHCALVIAVGGRVFGWRLLYQLLQPLDAEIYHVGRLCCFLALSPPGDCTVCLLLPDKSSCWWSNRHHVPYCTGTSPWSWSLLPPVQNLTAPTWRGQHWPWWQVPSCCYGAWRRMWRPWQWRSRVTRGLSQHSRAHQRSSPWRQPSYFEWLLRMAAQLLPWRRWEVGASRIRQLSKNPIRPLCGGSD